MQRLEQAGQFQLRFQRRSLQLANVPSISVLLTSHTTEGTVSLTCQAGSFKRMACSSHIVIPMQAHSIAETNCNHPERLGLSSRESNFNFISELPWEIAN